MSDSTVQIGAWVAFGAETEIEYRILPGADTIEFTLGGPHGLDLEMNEAGLRRCLSAFAGALTELAGSAASDSGQMSTDRSVDPAENRDFLRRQGGFG